MFKCICLKWFSEVHEHFTAYLAVVLYGFAHHALPEFTDALFFIFEENVELIDNLQAISDASRDLHSLVESFAMNVECSQEDMVDSLSIIEDTDSFEVTHFASE